jgi:hypothetical protein
LSLSNLEYNSVLRHQARETIMFCTQSNGFSSLLAILLISSSKAFYARCCVYANFIRKKTIK